MPNLVTVAQIKDYLGITGSTYDTLLGDLGDRAEAYINDLCNRPDGFGQDQWEEYLSGTGTSSVFVSNTPIDTNQSFEVFVDGTAVDADSYTVNPNTGEIRLKSSAPSLSQYANWGYSGQFGTIPPTDRGFLPAFPEGLLNVSVIYTGGYQTVPANLQQAVILASKVLWDSRKRDSGVASETLGDYSYTTAKLNDAQALFINYISPFVRQSML